MLPHVSSALINVLPLATTLDTPHHFLVSAIMWRSFWSRRDQRRSMLQVARCPTGASELPAPSRTFVRSHFCFVFHTAGEPVVLPANRVVHHIVGLAFHMLPVLPAGMLQRRQYLVDAGLIQDAWGSDDEPGQSHQFLARWLALNVTALAVEAPAATASTTQTSRASNTPSNPRNKLASRGILTAPALPSLHSLQELCLGCLGKHLPEVIEALGDDIKYIPPQARASLLSVAR
jgi:hypothetical protein